MQAPDGEDPEVLRSGDYGVPTLRGTARARPVSTCGELQRRRLVCRWLRQCEAVEVRRRRQGGFGRFGWILERGVGIFEQRHREFQRINSGGSRRGYAVNRQL